MIPRYSREEMTKIWSAEHRFKIWEDIEVNACDALAELGVIPKQAAENIRKNAGWNIDRIDEIEKTTRHDVLAFLTNMSENIGEDARFLHQGMTSSDVLDTAFAVQLKESSDLLLEGLEKVLKALKVKVEENLSLITIGRSHGIHAEPTSFGLKLATHYAAFSRARKRLTAAKAEIATCAISGPVGTFATVNPFVEQFVAKKLGLSIEPISTQIIPRDRHAMFFATLGVIASSIEAFAIEIRHLQRSEVREAEEPFAKGQKGSSAMPHKRNPVLAENLTGLARIIRAAVVPAMENVALWHERDISHSSVERVIAPDATIALDFALSRLASLIEGMTVYKERVLENLNSLGGLHFSQRLLLALTQKGMSREHAYAKVQSVAMELWHEIQQGKKVHFKDKVLSDSEIQNLLSQSEINACFDDAFYIQHANLIWERVLREMEN
ncbi:MAG: adenylosuccinate lyase [Alphaproteobacteria bacterium]|nr:adenylosuccinate lyase [Alphaproteobacteria bacterium]MCL2505009.1 adenylosuccinate lyase [Alphaproteobacteria bacterium]